MLMNSRRFFKYKTVGNTRKAHLFHIRISEYVRTHGLGVKDVIVEKDFCHGPKVIDFCVIKILKLTHFFRDSPLIQVKIKENNAKIEFIIF